MVLPLLQQEMLKMFSGLIQGKSDSKTVNPGDTLTKEMTVTHALEMVTEFYQPMLSKPFTYTVQALDNNQIYVTLEGTPTSAPAQNSEAIVNELAREHQQRMEQREDELSDQRFKDMEQRNKQDWDRIHQELEQQ